MEITPDKQNKNNVWFIVLGTAVTTALIIILLLYGFGLLGNLSPEVSMMHTEGMTHTEGMDHQMQMSGRQAEVAELGRQVMPFDLERTTHVFDKQDFGGVQQVLSDDSDPEQIALIQTHLQEEFASFQQGDFSDPAFIHGDAMPGLAALQADYEQIEVTYTDLPNGAQLTYASESPELIQAIHAWFEAQLADHGDHATQRP